MTTELLPKHLLVSDFSPGMKLAHILVIMSNEPGSLEKAAAIAASEVNILTGLHYASTGARDGLWSFFADFTEASLTPADFAARLKSLPSVREVKFHEAANGLIADSFHFPPMSGGEPAIIIQRETLSTFLGRVREILGTGPVARVIIGEMGVSAGKAACQTLKAKLGVELVRQQMKELMNLYTAAGWGVTSVSELNYESKRVVVRVRENFECLPSKGKESEPHSYFVRGDLSGWFSELFGNKAECVETLCIAKGDDFCEFSLQA